MISLLQYGLLTRWGTGLSSYHSEAAEDINIVDVLHLVFRHVGDPLRLEDSMIDDHAVHFAKHLDSPLNESVGQLYFPSVYIVTLDQ